MEIVTIDEKRENYDLLDPDFLRKLDQLSLVARRVFPGTLRGERRSTRRGASVEFADYRNYTAGDDLRRVDWNVYARLEKLFLKLFVEEEDLHVYILLDCSRSMSFGSPSKLLYAKRLAAALSYIALGNLDRVGLGALNGSAVHTLTPKRGKRAVFGIFDWLSSIQASGPTDLGESLRDFTRRTSRPGVLIVISDFLDENYRSGLAAALSRRFEVTLLQVLDEEEVNPSLVGDLLLIDSENGDRREITMGQTLLKRYRERFAQFCKDIENFSTRYGCNYVRVTNQTGFDVFLLPLLGKVVSSKG